MVHVRVGRCIRVSGASLASFIERNTVTPESLDPRKEHRRKPPAADPHGFRDSLGRWVNEAQDVRSIGQRGLDQLVAKVEKSRLRKEGA